MPIVTFTSDFGLNDHYVAVIKGAILSRNPNLPIIDITHNIKNYDIVQAAFAIKNTYPSFPDGTIHLVSINNFMIKPSRFLAIFHDNQYFIGPDNGVFSLVFNGVPDYVFDLEYNQNLAFPLSEIFSGVVGFLLSGGQIQELGNRLYNIEERISLQPVISPSQIRGSVIYIDNYENAILNVSKELFSRVYDAREFALSFKRHDPIRKLCKHYSDAPIGEPLCLFNSADYLEIAINMGKASSLLGLKVDDTIQIDFL